MTALRHPIVMTSLGIMGLSPVMAGCASAADSAPMDLPERDTITAEEAPTPAPEPAAIDQVPGNYADGTYVASGGYQSPNGPETIEVSLTLADGVVTAVEVTPQAAGTSQRYQDQFAGGVAAETVGKPIDQIDVSRIAGSSLTSGGFREALTVIKADASR
jgi:uncharacterized protein with FMN-binding domain